MRKLRRCFPQDVNALRFQRLEMVQPFRFRDGLGPGDSREFALHILQPRHS